MRVTLLFIINLKGEHRMSNFITVGRRLIPHKHIALVEPYAPVENPRVQTTREFFGRVVLINRDSILIGERPEDFAKANGLRMIEDDKVAVNPAGHFRVETFLPTEGFTPAKAAWAVLAAAVCRWRPRAA
jgi:hypothetical protein